MTELALAASRAILSFLADAQSPSQISTAKKWITSKTYVFNATQITLSAQTESANKSTLLAKPMTKAPEAAPPATVGMSSKV